MIENTFYTNSRLDNVSGLLSKFAYVEGNTNMPIVVLIHGYNLTIDAIGGSILRRIANEGFFAVAIGMRGRKGATGRRDASARELHDIYDGINYIKANYPVSDKVIISGYSGGGGNALGFAVKFPFVANTIVNHFGMVDYGFDEVESWYARNTQYRGGIQSFVGHDRSVENMNYYRSRNAHEALKNIQAKVFNYHDIEDTGVSVELTTYLTNGLQTLNKTHETNISNINDSARYHHNMSVSALSEPDWLPYGREEGKPEMPTSGSFRVLGYLVTDEFKVFLGNLDDHVADVSYNITQNTFTITPLTGEMSVVIEKGDLQQVIHISEATSFEFDGQEILPEPEGKTQNVKRYFIKEDSVYIPIKKKFVKENSTWKIIK